VAGPAGRPPPTLDRFNRGSAAPGLKADMEALLGALAHYARLDEAVLAVEQPGLLARLRTLPAGADLARILRQEPVRHRTHSRPNVSASLRDMRRRRGRAPTDADYQSGHVVPVLAAAYWGSIADWAERAPARVQHRKGHWRQKAVQLAAVRDVYARFPGRPLTSELLRAAGYHALVVALTAADLQAICDEAGVPRNLAKPPASRHTEEGDIDAYANICRTRGVTCSSHALMRIGGRASSLRTRVAIRHGCFAAFQAAAAARHPQLRPPGRPTSADGTPLDSWQEVVVHNALRRALPGVSVAAHVLLPDGRRSVDFVVGGMVHVEVLGIARADMAGTGSKRQVKYARQWTAKLALFDACGIDPVVAEPADVDDPARLSALVAEVASRLGAAQPLLASQAPGPRIRAKGVWDTAFLNRVVAEVAAALGRWPTHAELADRGYSHAANLLKRPGVAARVSAAIGVPRLYVRGLWTEARIVDALVAWVQTHGHVPTRSDLVAAGHSALAGAHMRLKANRRAAVQAAVEARCGLPRAKPRARGREVRIAEFITLFQPLCDQLGRFPTVAERAAAGLPPGLSTTVSGLIGMQALAARLGVSYHGPRRMTHAEALAEFRALQPIGARQDITTTQIKSALSFRGIAVLHRHFGGIARLRAELAVGYDAERAG